MLRLSHAGHLDGVPERSQRFGLENDNMRLTNKGPPDAYPLTPGILATHNLIDSINVAVIVLDMTGHILDINRIGHERLGYTKDEMVGRRISQFNSPESAKRVPDKFAELKANGKAIFEVEHARKDGTIIPCEVNARLITLNGEQCALGVVSDITERKKLEHFRHEQEKRLHLRNKLYAALLYTNQALVECKTESELYHKICQIAVDYGGMAMTWIGTADTASGQIRPVARYGIGQEYLDRIMISVSADVPEGRGPVGFAYRDQRSVVCQDVSTDPMMQPWQGLATKYGWRGAAAFGIGRGGRSHAVITFYHYEMNAFNAETAQLLEEMAKNIGYALDRFDLEMERQRAVLALERSVKRYEKIIESAVDGFIIIDSRGKILDVNGAYVARSGYTREELLQLYMQDLKEIKGDNGVLDNVKEVAKRGFARFESVHRTKDGIAWPIEVSAVSFPEEDCTIGFLYDLTERRKAEDELRVAANVFESQEAMMVTDADATIIRVNKAFTKISGYAADEVIGKNPRILQSGRHDASFYAAMWNKINLEGGWQGEIWDKRKGGEIYPKWLTITAVKNRNNKTTHYVGTFVDLTEYKEARDKIDHLAFYDQLTGLPNRHLALERLRHALDSSARKGIFGAILYIDVDQFKVINDTLGHDAGDKVLQNLAKVMKASVRREDTIARIGGDEFVIIAEDLSRTPEVAATQAKLIGDKMRVMLNGVYSVNDKDFAGSVSIGVALFKGAQDGVHEILKRGDLAMYDAKKAGRNALRFFDPSMQVALERRTQLENDLRRALDQGQFRLYFQKQVGQRGEVRGAEALLRWIHPQRGVMAPMDFIPLAEETGLIMPIGKWILEECCRCLKAWQSQEKTKNFRLSMNVSAIELKQPYFVDSVREVVQSSKIDPSCLILEITESMLLDNIEQYILKMRQLRDIGLTFALDDFGTGYSSLSYLKKLPLGELKIDRSFVKDLGKNKNDDAIVKTIIQMANTLGIDVIAEGVETQDHLEILELYGCNNYQGYLFGPAVSLETFERDISQ